MLRLISGNTPLNKVVQSEKLSSLLCVTILEIPTVNCLVLYSMHNAVYMFYVVLYQAAYRNEQRYNEDFRMCPIQRNFIIMVEICMFLSWRLLISKHRYQN